MAGNRADLQGSVTLKARSSQVANPGVSILKLSSLRPGQRKLYELIVSKLEAEEIVTLREAEQIWRSRVAQNMIKGVPHRMTYYPDPDPAIDNWYLKLVPMSREEITFSVLNWLTKNIGLLVIRGYLKVIPMIEVEWHAQGSDMAAPDPEATDE